ncbi:hypothetical protein [Actinacidiphila alni]|uniref:hypothetical protein n=1 Tax=Actinacidiphila alni TaxID=380248 RepID=UPI00345507F9
MRLAALIALLDDAVGAQTAADQAIAVCGEPLLLVTAQQQVVRQAEVYHQLVVRLRALNPDETCAPLHRRASRLLAFHEALLQEALSRVSAAPHGPAEERARRQLLGLGAPADALRRLRDEVSALADRSDATGDRS